MIQRHIDPMNIALGNQRFIFVEIGICIQIRIAISVCKSMKLNIRFRFFCRLCRIGRCSEAAEEQRCKNHPPSNFRLFCFTSLRQSPPF